MSLDRIPVVFMYRPGPNLLEVAKCDAWGGEWQVFSPGVGFNLAKTSRTMAREFGRRLKWALRNDPECDSEMWSPFVHSG